MRLVVQAAAWRGPRYLERRPPCLRHACARGGLHAGAPRRACGRHFRRVPCSRAPPVKAQQSNGEPDPLRDQEQSVQRRSEVEAPFRALRLVLYGFFAGSAAVGALIALTQVVAALGRGESAAVPLSDAATSLGVDVAAVAVFVLLFRNDWQARAAQIARMTREERLGALPLRLATGRRVALADLRTFARPVLVAGTREQVDAAVAAAAPHRAALLERGVMVVPLPIYSDLADGAIPPGGAPDGDAGEQRWQGQPLQLAQWLAWFEEQVGLAKKTGAQGLYVSLRMDGRVRGSGVGCPPWARIAATLPPTKGIFQGFLDGLDGRV